MERTSQPAVATRAAIFRLPEEVLLEIVALSISGGKPHWKGRVLSMHQRNGTALALMHACRKFQQACYIYRLLRLDCHVWHLSGRANTSEWRYLGLVRSLLKVRMEDYAASPPQLEGGLFSVAAVPSSRASR